MADIVSEEQRSYNMSRIRGKDTKPELRVRSLLHRMGFRFTVNASNNRELPGRPDLVLPGRRTVIFVHGCFWHGHEGCKDFRIPKTRTDWWQAKIDGNRARDKRAQVALAQLGWRVIVVWSCELANASKVETFKARMREELGSSSVPRFADRCSPGFPPMNK